ncbi:MAG: AAA family ATPase [bacterium]|nr:AAA family ATPase [bacterium]
MKTLRALCPRPPAWGVDWSAIDAEYDWVRALRDCPQSPEWHTEGNVWIHTRMVLEELTRLNSWRALDEEARFTVFTACLLHDVAKPSTTRTESDGRITARRHSERGAILARAILWRLGAPFAWREEICNMIVHHQVPFFLAGKAGAERLAARISWTCRCDRLSIIAEADGRGRICADQPDILENVELFRLLCSEQGCLGGPRPFASDTHRVEYFQSSDRHAEAPVPPAHRCEVTVMSGLPGSGKDHWIERNSGGRPVVSPDGVRAELGVSPTGNQGTVVQTCRERAREHLRASEDFVWNATNLSAAMRAQVLELFRQYGARIRIVYVETDPESWAARNRARAEPIPGRALEKMLTRWEVPDACEAHAVEYVVSAP